MILFAFPAYVDLGSNLASLLRMPVGHFFSGRFPNQEMHAVIQTVVANEGCPILGTIAPPDEQLLSTLLLSHTLKKKQRVA